ncbi:MAG TPA: pilus assembly protein TadG-related protein [Caulobacteraceae bacterium]
MTKVITRAKSLGQRLRNRLFGYLPNRRGNVAAIVALAMVPLCGVMGMAAEGSNWFLNNRAQQNAADAAVVAAANAGLQDYYANCASSCSWGSNYEIEGKAVANKFGYLNGTGNVTVTVAGPDTPVPCPVNVTIKIASAASCFQVTISKPVPLYMTHLLGFNGNKGTGVEWISATAYAAPVSEPADICLLTLGWGSYDHGQQYAMQFHGSSSINLEGCPVGTNGGMDCTGHSTLNAPYGVDGNSGTDKKSCGDFEYGTTSPIADPYASLDSSIPTHSCSGYTGATSVPLADGSPTAPQYEYVCGNLVLGAATPITGNEVIVIENGSLDLHGQQLTTSGSGGVTIIFTSPPGMSPPASVSGGGDGYLFDSAGGGGINISSNPAGSGTWAGVTVYQDPTPWNSCDCNALTGTTNTTYIATWHGNSSDTAWSLSGAYYLPNANLILDGATDKASNGYNCFDMVVNSIDSNGGNNFSMFANPLSQCGQQGTNTPHVYGFRYALVG